MEWINGARPPQKGTLLLLLAGLQEADRKEKRQRRISPDSGIFFLCFSIFTAQFIAFLKFKFKPHQLN